MPVQNAEVAEVFERYADLLEIEGANPFRVRAYRSAAGSLRGMPRRLADRVAEGEDLSKLRGIGEELAEKIAEIVTTGRLEALERLEAEAGPELADLMDLPHLGPKRVKALRDELGVRSFAELEAACRERRVRELEGFAEKTERDLLEALERRDPKEEARRLWSEVEPVAESLAEHLRAIEGVKRVTVAGSYRRCKETVGDLDLLATCKKGTPVTDRFVEHEDVAEVVSHGTTRSTVRLRSGLQVDLRVVPAVSYGAALHYFTGSKAHNIAIRKLGVRRGLKVNEYGVFRGEERVAGRTEEEVYAAVELPYVPPELREDRGELEAAREGTLPTLVEVSDLRGDLHAHTTATDGKASLREMAEAALELGHAYLAITDHTQSTRVANGQDPRRLRRQLREIERLNEELEGEGLTLLKGAEVDILRDGSLDLPDDVLAELDLTVCSIHADFERPAEQQTERILRAMDHPRFHVLGHPTGRLLGRRDAYALDVERVIEGAAERGCFLELNARPRRLDLPDYYAQMARERGVLVAISSDAHAAGHLEGLRYGVAQARRGWLERKDVLNARSLRELRRCLKR